MSYHISKKLSLSYDAAVEKATAELKKEGFGVLTEIDVKATLKAKIGADFRRYVILGACNPNYAHQALLAEDKVGVYMPCNVIVQETDDGGSEVSAMNPLVAMQAIENPGLAGFAQEVTAALTRVVEKM